jgi:PAS domain S-box-containing protein
LKILSIWDNKIKPQEMSFPTSDQHEAAAFLAALIESSDDAIVSKTLDGVILTWNPAAERVYGYPAGEAIGRAINFLLPPGRPDEESEILQRIRNGERVDHYETIRKRKDGELISVSLTISPIRSNGTIIGASHIARDITKQRQLEEQLRHTQKLESLGVLAGGVAHDFNNLLTGILGNASLALDTTSSTNPVRGMLRDILSAAEHASHLTRQLLAYAGKGRFVVEPINLSALVREISHLIQTSIPKSVQLRLDLQEDLPAIEADGSQMQQLIMNLVINGAEAIGEGNVGTVLVSTRVQDIDEQYLGTTVGHTSLAPGRYVNLEVHDTGSGMDEATVQRIFDPFFTTKFMGRGLGLAAVQGIVHSHKGGLTVYSRPGRGSTFKVLLPAVNQPQPKKDPEAEQVFAGSGAVLVVDDEQIVRRTAKAMLERYGYTVVLAENGQEAVTLFKMLADQIELVLLDMTMPVMGGDETFRALQQIRPNVKVILSSGYNEVEAVRRFTGKGLAGFIQKPYSASALANKVKMVLELAQNA